MESYIVRVADVVNAAAAEVVVGSLCILLAELQMPACAPVKAEVSRTDIISAHVSCFRTQGVVGK